jgi:hypothetical protein
MKKIFIIVIGIIIVGFIVYLVLPQDEVSSITIVMMENDLDSNYIGNVINEISNISINSSDDITAKLILPKGINQEFKIEAPLDFQEEKEYRKKNIEKLMKNIFKKVNLTNSDANIQIESLVNI